MEARSISSSQELHLSASLAPQIHQLLNQFCEESEVLYATLLKESGTLYADAGSDSLRDSKETCLLAADAFEALRKFAEQLGESYMEGFFYEGKSRHFCLTPVSPPFLLLSVFETPVRFAVVKTCAHKIIPKILAVLQAGDFDTDSCSAVETDDFTLDANVLFPID